MIEQLERTEAADYTELHSLQKELTDLLEEMRTFLNKKQQRAAHK
ncbi:hypothetical protein [Paenibacillus sp. YN15]|nr:hypothetical protein [Paenibacillus sp. YN15]